MCISTKSSIPLYLHFWMKIEAFVQLNLPVFLWTLISNIKFYFLMDFLNICNFLNIDQNLSKYDTNPHYFCNSHFVLCFYHNLKTSPSQTFHTFCKQFLNNFGEEILPISLFFRSIFSCKTNCLEN